MAVSWPLMPGRDWTWTESSTASLPDVAIVYAKMSSQAYENRNDRENVIGGFNYLWENSNELFAVYYQPDMNLYVIAIKGTSTWKELILDDGTIFFENTPFGIPFPLNMLPTPISTNLTEINNWAAGSEEPEGPTRLEQLAEGGAHPANIHVTGHSLGGWIAIELAKKFKDRISGGHVFNGGSNVLTKYGKVVVLCALPLLPLALFPPIIPLVPLAVASVSSKSFDIPAPLRADKVSHGEFHHHHIIGDPFTL